MQHVNVRESVPTDRDHRPGDFNNESSFSPGNSFPPEAAGPRPRSGQVRFLREPSHRGAGIPQLDGALGTERRDPRTPPLPHFRVRGDKGPGWREEKAALMPQGTWGQGDRAELPTPRKGPGGPGRSRSGLGEGQGRGGLVLSSGPRGSARLSRVVLRRW